MVERWRSEFLSKRQIDGALSARSRLGSFVKVLLSGKGLERVALAHESIDSTRPSAVAHARRLPGKLKIIAAIIDGPVVERMTMPLGLQVRAPPLAPAHEQMPLQAA